MIFPSAIRRGLAAARLIGRDPVMRMSRRFFHGRAEITFEAGYRQPVFPGQRTDAPCGNSHPHEYGRMTLPGILHHIGSRWAAGIGVALGIGAMALIGTVFRPAHEVLYSGAVSMSYCAPAAGAQACSFQYSFSIGNTGTEKQDSVRIARTASLPRAGVTARVSEIVAGAGKTPQPEIRRESATGEIALTVSELAPNTLVDIELLCMLCAPDDLSTFREISARVEAQGRAREGDPRVSALMNGMMNFLRVIGLFR